METIQIAVAELDGDALDWVVSRMLRWDVGVDEFLRSQVSCSKFSYSRVWAKFGPIMSELALSLIRESDGFWYASISGGIPYKGATIQKAVLRAYVASVQGDFVKVPYGVS